MRNNKDDIVPKKFNAPVNDKSQGEGGKKRIQENLSFKIFSLGKKWHRRIKKSLPNYCDSFPPTHPPPRPLPAHFGA